MRAAWVPMHEQDGYATDDEATQRRHKSYSFWC